MKKPMGIGKILNGWVIYRLTGGWVIIRPLWDWSNTVTKG